jgi:hypothetical protein
MLVEFTNTPDDIRQATLVTSEFRRNRNRKSRASVVVMIVFVVYYLSMKFFWQLVGGMNTLEIWINLLIPSLAVMVLGLLMGALAMMKVGVNPRPTWRSVVSLASMPVLILIVRWAMKLNPSPGAPAAWPDWRILLPHSTWLMFMAIVSGFMLRGQTLARMWEKQPELHCAKKAEITAEGVVISDDVSRLEYRWIGFIDGKETASLFLLLVTDRLCVIIPKRGFANDEQLAGMRNLMRLIWNGQPKGFPVNILPAAA